MEHCRHVDEQDLDRQQGERAQCRIGQIAAQLCRTDDRDQTEYIVDQLKQHFQSCKDVYRDWTAGVFGAEEPQYDDDKRNIDRDRCDNGGSAQRCIIAPAQIIAEQNAQQIQYNNGQHDPLCRLWGEFVLDGFDEPVEQDDGDQCQKDHSADQQRRFIYRSKRPDVGQIIECIPERQDQIDGACHCQQRGLHALVYGVLDHGVDLGVGVHIVVGEQVVQRGIKSAGKRLCR